MAHDVLCVGLRHDEHVRCVDFAERCAHGVQDDQFVWLVVER